MIESERTGLLYRGLREYRGCNSCHQQRGGNSRDGLCHGEYPFERHHLCGYANWMTILISPRIYKFARRCEWWKLFIRRQHAESIEILQSRPERVFLSARPG